MQRGPTSQSFEQLLFAIGELAVHPILGPQPTLLMSVAAFCRYMHTEGTTVRLVPLSDPSQVGPSLGHSAGLAPTCDDVTTLQQGPATDALDAPVVETHIDIPDIDPDEIDMDSDDATLVREFDAGDGCSREVFGALDVGGLEDADEDEVEDEGPDLTNDGAYSDCRSCCNSLPDIYYLLLKPSIRNIKQTLVLLQPSALKEIGVQVARRPRGRS